jgi:hypothetical protein
MLAKHARSGQGKVSKASRAREGDITKAVTELDKPSLQPKVPSNIPGSGVQGVPNAQTGLASQGPAIASSVARMGGQVRLAPGQFRAWAHPRDAKQLAKPSDQTKSPPPAKPVY